MNQDAGRAAVARPPSAVEWRQARFPGMATSDDDALPLRPQAGRADALASPPAGPSSPSGDQAAAPPNQSPVEAATICAVPFTLKRSSDLWEASSYTTKTETVHGLLRLAPGRLVFQWRLAVRTQRLGDVSWLGGAGWTTKDEIDPVRQIAVPLDNVAGAAVSRSRWGFLRGPRLVVTAADLVAFDEIAGGHGLKLKHPAKLVLRVKRADRLLAEEFAAELALALARLPNGAGESAGLAPWTD